MLYIFDLDGTAINSNHRKATLPDGTLDLVHWKQNSTPAQIAKDTLLPLAKLWRTVQDDSFIIICTARVMGKPDLAFLAANDLRFDEIVSRAKDCTLPDHWLKELGLRKLAGQLGYSWSRFQAEACIWDDCEKVLAHMRWLGFHCFDAKVLNHG